MNKNNELAKRFLRAHGWFQDKENPFNPEAWFHPAFPLGEELLETHKKGKKEKDIKHGYKTVEEFVESVYGTSWELYKNLKYLSYGDCNEKTTDATSAEEEVEKREADEYHE